MAEEVLKVQAVVTVTRNWFERAALDSLLAISRRSSGEAPVIFLPVTQYSLADSVFIEITMYPRSMAPKPLKLHIPKSEVLTIMEIENPGDVKKLGFFGEVDTNIGQP